MGRPRDLKSSSRQCCTPQPALPSHPQWAGNPQGLARCLLEREVSCPSPAHPSTHLTQSQPLVLHPALGTFSIGQHGALSTIPVTHLPIDQTGTAAVRAEELGVETEVGLGCGQALPAASELGLRPPFEKNPSGVAQVPLCWPQEELFQLRTGLRADLSVGRGRPEEVGWGPGRTL